MAIKASCITGSTYRVGGVAASASRMGSVAALASRIGGIKASVTLICAINRGRYLRIVPTETQWVDVSLFATYNVKTSGEWMLE